MKKYIKYIITICFVLTYVFIITSCQNINQNQTNNNNAEKQSSFTLAMTGDALIHGFIHDEAKKDDLNYYKMLEPIESEIKKYDVAFYNQEATLGGKELGLWGYPRFNSPYEFGDTMIRLGFNLVSLANNHTFDWGEQAIYNSYKYWEVQDNVMTAGSYLSEEQRIEPKINTINDISYTMLAYTWFSNVKPLPEGKEYLVNMYSRKKAKEDIKRLRDKVDVIIVSIHTGKESHHEPTKRQFRIAKDLAKYGADIVIGHHAHVVQPVDIINNTVVFYGLGNMISSNIKENWRIGLLGSLKIEKNIINGESSINIRDVKGQLLWIGFIDEKDRNYRHNFKVYPFSKLNDEILPDYKMIQTKYNSIITSLNDSILVDNPRLQ